MPTRSTADALRHLEIISQHLPAAQRIRCSDALRGLVEALGLAWKDHSYLAKKLPAWPSSDRSRRLRYLVTFDNRESDQTIYLTSLDELCHLFGVTQHSLRIMLSRGRGDLTRNTALGRAGVSTLEGPTTFKAAPHLKPLAARFDRVAKSKGYHANSKSKP